ncbi:AbiH family protein [Roseburia hominis]
MNPINPTTLFLIVNGFDTAHKLSTSYACFRAFVCGQYNVEENSASLVPQSTQLPDGGERYDPDEVATYIVQVIDMAVGGNWGDLESCLGFQLYERLRFDLRVINYEGNDNDMWNDAEVNGQLASGLRYTFEEMKHLFYRWVKERLSVINYEDAAGNTHTEETRNGIKKLLTGQDMEKTAFLCFNYTYTLQKLYDVQEDGICQIHGTVDGSEESILFGHGDESDIENS